MHTLFENDKNSNINIENSRKKVESFIKSTSYKIQNLDFENVEKNVKVFESLKKTFPNSSLNLNYVRKGPRWDKFQNLIIKKQRSWREQRSKDTLIPYNFNGYHSHETNHFVNKQTIMMNVNLEKQERLLHAYRAKYWENSIFNDELFMETAFALFAKGKLKGVEFETLLIMDYAKRTLQDSKEQCRTNAIPLESYALLNDQHEFTEAAKKFILPHLKEFMFKNFEFKNIQNLKFICQAFFEIFPSENVFFIANIARNDLFSDVMAPQLHHLSTTIYPDINIKGEKGFFFHGFQHKNKPIKKIIFSCSLQDALKLSWSNVEETVAARSMAGILLPLDIMKHVALGIWPADVSFNNVPRALDIHDSKDMHDFSRKDHDDYHARLLTNQRSDFRQLTNH